MAIKVLIVEDEVLVAEEIAADLEDYGFLVTDIAISSKECLDAIEKNTPHIILMDINIKGEKDGIETAAIIKATHNIPIVYLTANTDKLTITRALETLPSAFISKPYQKKDLSISIEVAFNKHNENLLINQPLIKDSFFVKSGELYVKINTEDINYIEADGSYCIIHTSTKQYTISSNLNHFENNHNNPIFVKTHRSYIINIQKVEAFNPESVIINGTSIPISKTHQKEIIKFFNKL
jgi:DNA-binding LytR/AlgR family response regulator